jgi:hypothetical protein
MKSKERFLNLMYVIAVSILMTAIFFVSAAFHASQAQETPEEFKPSGKVWGYVFGDIYYKVQGDTALGIYNGAEYGNVKEGHSSFAIRRLYLGYEYTISPVFTANVLLEGGDAILTTDSKRTVFIKRMDVEVKKLIPRASVFVGQTGTPSFAISEKVWGYRSIEKTLTDFRKMSLSNDLGIKITGKIDRNGIFGYSAMIGTGRAEKPEDNNMKRLYGGLDASLLNKKLILSMNIDYEDVARYGGDNSNMNLIGFIGYQLDMFTIGVEAATQIQERSKTNLDLVTNVKDTLDKSLLGISVFARGTLMKDKLFAFARWDNFIADTDCNKGDNTSKPYEETFITAGIDYAPHKNVHIMPNIWINSYKDLREKPANYDVSTNASSFYERDADVVARLTVYFIFK